MSDRNSRNIQIRNLLAAGPIAAESLRAALDVSRPTLARALAAMSGEIVTLGAARSTRYALRDRFRGLPDMTVYRVNEKGQITPLGLLCPVTPEGFLMLQSDGATVHHEGLPWWMTDMRPQGFLGRAYAHQHAAGLGLPPDIRHWSDNDALRALLVNGGDAVGNLLLGDHARNRFVNAPAPVVVHDKEYPHLSTEALKAGQTWSSAGGEQPKFCAYTAHGHVLVKFSAPDDNSISKRWRDLLLAEHIALDTLVKGGISAARSRVVDLGVQRFLEVRRFDRVGVRGRRTLLSLAALDGEFVGNASEPWPVVTSELARQKTITAQSNADAALLYAFGTLIGNTDMHSGNLSFVSDDGPPFSLSHAYDMLPMAFSPSASGVVRDTLAVAHLHPSIQGDTWREAQVHALQYVNRISEDTRFSGDFQPCIKALRQHLEEASQRIERLG